MEGKKQAEHTFLKITLVPPTQGEKNKANLSSLQKVVMTSAFIDFYYFNFDWGY